MSNVHPLFESILDTAIAHSPTLSRRQINEADLDVVANRVLGYRSFDTSSAPTAHANAVLADATRQNLRRIVKDAMREMLGYLDEA